MPHHFMDPGSLLRKGLKPVIGGVPAVLILGSFPGRISLSQNRYYGNPKNQFWHIIEALTGIDRHLPYDQRVEKIVKNRIALWDVISTCQREGSADHRIRNPSLNPVRELLNSHPGIRAAIFNGTTASRYAASLRLPDDIMQVTLPSTSPANTRFTLAEKTGRWAVLQEIQKPKARIRKIKDTLPFQPEFQENDVVDCVEPDEDRSTVPEDREPEHFIWEG